MIQRQRDRQRGQETLQAVLAVSLMLLPVLLGIIELGGLIHVWMGQQSAAAIGARVAAERGEDDAVVRERIRTELQAAGITPASVVVSISPSSVRWGEPIQVQLVSHRRVAIPFLFSTNVDLRSSYIGRGEVNH
ncbi:MAG: pilus assembly protein [Candidatus Dormibacteraeota bacterium]|nr:pilus assembly protein [Candidatus Dormibacteraeota bacterium]